MNYDIYASYSISIMIVASFYNAIWFIFIILFCYVLQEGFRYHHAEPDYLMLVYWIPKTAHTLPANASHRVGIGAFVINSKREVFLLQFSLIISGFCQSLHKRTGWFVKTFFLLLYIWCQMKFMWWHFWLCY